MLATQRAKALSQFSSSTIDFIRSRDENPLDRIRNTTFVQEDMLIELNEEGMNAKISDVPAMLLIWASRLTKLD